MIHATSFQKCFSFTTLPTRRSLELDVYSAYCKRLITSKTKEKEAKAQMSEAMPDASVVIILCASISKFRSLSCGIY